MPFTFILDGKVPHTAQHYVEGKVANDLGYELFEISKKSIKELAGMVCLDLVLKNTDRHSNNWLISKDRIYAIDNSIGKENITIKEALRPAFRCLLINDHKYSNILADNIIYYLSNFLSINKNNKKIEESIHDVYQWKKDLSQMSNKGLLIK